MPTMMNRQGGTQPIDPMPWVGVWGVGDWSAGIFHSKSSHQVMLLNITVRCSIYSDQNDASFPKDGRVCTQLWFGKSGCFLHQEGGTITTRPYESGSELGSEGITEPRVTLPPVGTTHIPNCYVVWSPRATWCSTWVNNLEERQTHRQNLVHLQLHPSHYTCVSRQDAVLVLILLVRNQRPA